MPCVSSVNKRGGEVTWSYSWSSDKKSDVNLELVPMYWSANIQKPREFVQKILLQHAKVILGFNDPERGEQATTNPIAVAKIWKKYIEPLRSKRIR